jgi:4-amino-4-deoxychorismate lyase
VRVLALLDGTLADPEAPVLRADDLGVLRGDGIFETILVIDGQPLELEAHLARLARSAAMLDLPAPDLDAWRRCARTVVDAWRGGREMVLKLVLSRGPEAGRDVTGFATGAPVPESLLAQRRDGIAAVTLTRGVAPDLAGQAPWLLLGAKTLSYAVNMAALREAARRGADDVVFTATDGSVLEGPTSTVVVAQGTTLRTPPVEAGILPGTTRGALFRAAAAAGWQTREEPVAAAELPTADGVWLVSSIRLIARIHTLDGAQLPDPGSTSEFEGMLREAVSGVA